MLQSETSSPKTCRLEEKVIPVGVSTSETGKISHPFIEFESLYEGNTLRFLESSDEGNNRYL